MADNYIQQDDNYKDFMTTITDGGLQYAYQSYKQGKSARDFYRQHVADDKKKHVIVVGAGMAGLAAAYELSQVGHKVGFASLCIDFYSSLHFIETKVGSFERLLK